MKQTKALRAIPLVASQPAAGLDAGGQAAGRNLIQVIGRAAAILRALEGEPDGLSLGQLAQRCGLARSTAQRIAGALEAEQLLIAASPTGRMRLGPALLRLASSVQTDLATLAGPVIKRLSDELGETVDLAALRRDHLIFLHQVVGSHRLRAVSATGDTFPLYCTANGKAVLAQMDDSEVASLVGSDLVQRTPHTLTTMRALLSDLARTRKTGLAFDRQEHTQGICAAGVALTDPLGNRIAISVPVPNQRFAENEAAITSALLRARAELQRLFADRT